MGSVAGEVRTLAVDDLALGIEVWTLIGNAAAFGGEVWISIFEDR